MRVAILPEASEDEAKVYEVEVRCAYSTTPGSMALWKLRRLDKLVDELTEDLLNAAAKDSLAKNEAWCAVLTR